MSKSEILGTLSKNIKRYLNEYDMTQAELARRLDVSGQAITNWVNGTGEPRMSKIDKMCEIFHCKRSDLLEERSPKSPDDIFIEKFQRLEPHEQDVVMQLIDTLLENARKKERRASAS